MTSRANALNEVKRLLLEEVSVFILSEENWNISETIIDGQSTVQDFYEKNIQAIMGGITKTIILDESWNGEIYWIKAEVTFDPDDIKTKTSKIVDNKEKLVELEKSKQKLNEAEAEIARLKAQLEQANSEKGQSQLLEAYNKEVNTLSASEWFDKAWYAYSEDNYEEAISYSKQVIAIDPEYVGAYNILGNVYYKQGNQKKSDQYYKKYYELGGE